MNRRLRTLSLLTVTLLVASFAVSQVQRSVRGTDGPTVLSRSDSLYHQARHMDAVHALDEEIAEHPEDPILLFNRGVAAQLAGQGGDRIWFERSLVFDPEAAHTRWKLGEALTREGNLDSGEVHLAKAVQIDPAYFEARVALGRNLRLQGRVDEAIRVIEQTITPKRTYPYSYIELAACHFQENRLRTAADILEEGRDRFPYEQVLIELIRMYGVLEDSAGLHDVGEQYLTFYPIGPNREEVLQILDAKIPSVPFDADTVYKNIAYPDDYEVYDPAEILPVNKRLHYDVRYSLLKLGDLTVDVREGIYKGKPSWRIQYIARTAPGLPFITVNDTFRAYVHHDIRHTQWLEMRYREKDYTSHTVYDADYQTGWFSERTIEGDGHWYYIEHPIPPNTFDATSMLWYSQQLVVQETGGVSTNEISGGFEHTIINYKGPDGSKSFGDETYDVVHVDGMLKYSGMVGLTGDYKGWFMQDSPFWPLVGKFKIFLGSITIRYDHAGDTPMPAGPSFVEYPPETGS
ncbi:DUF3108 domain-containing protein [bacterium]|nr:DUF3108 domain-containing protein [bacterium]